MEYLRCFLIVLSMSAFSCGELSAQQIDWAAKLEQGYQSGSQEPLIAFLDAWHADSKPITADIMKKKLPFERDVYDVYSSFFSMTYEDIYDKTKYVIIPNKINVVVVDSDMQVEFTLEPRDRHLGRVDKLIETRTVSRVVIEDFRPYFNDVRFEDKWRVLYWQDKYIAALLGFLTQHKNPYELLRGDLYWQETAGTQDRKKRLQYLNTPLQIVPGHWGRGWIFETYPTVSKICLNSKRNRAIIRYRALGYRFGEALLEKSYYPDIGGDYWEILSNIIYRVE